MALQYTNEAKRLRAVKQLRDEALQRGDKSFVPSEEQIKERYLKIGGAVVDTPDVVPQPSVEERLEKVEEAVDIKPRRGRPKKADSEEVSG